MLSQSNFTSQDPFSVMSVSWFPGLLPTHFGMKKPKHQQQGKRALVNPTPLDTAKIAHSSHKSSQVLPGRVPTYIALQ